MKDSSWITIPLRDTLEIIGGGTPKTNNPTYWGGDIPWISVVDFGNGRKFIWDTEKKITNQGLENSSTKILKKGQIVISARGTVGEIGVTTRDMAFNQSCYGLSATSLTNNDFLYYLLQSNIDQLKKKTHGAVFDTITRDTFSQVLVILPPLPEQRAIADVLSALDDKIELNRRMNQTLEELTQTLFKHMFIDNPEREKWKIGTLGEIAENIRRAGQPRNFSISTPYIGLEHIPQKSIALSQWGNAEDVSSNKFAFKKGEILFGKLRPYFHKVGIAPIDGICSTDVLVIMPKSFNYYGFVLGIISSIEFIETVNVASEGTKMPRTNWTYMSSYPVKIPPEELVKEYNRVIKPMLDQIIVNIHESRTLAELRDTLLPKLMSGQVRVTSSVTMALDASSSVASKSLS